MDQRFEQYTLEHSTPVMTEAESRQRRARIDQEASRFVRFFRAGGVAILAGIALAMVTGSENDHERDTERCVSALVGRPADHPVDLVPEPEGGLLQHPPSVLEEQLACERNANNITLARQDLNGER